MGFRVLSDADLTPPRRLIVFACWLIGSCLVARESWVVMVDVKRYDTMHKDGMWHVYATYENGRVREIGAMPCPVHAHEYVASLYRRMMD